jgi:hypothetical protein
MPRSEGAQIGAKDPSTQDDNDPRYPSDHVVTDSESGSIVFPEIPRIPGPVAVISDTDSASLPPSTVSRTVRLSMVDEEGEGGVSASSSGGSDERYSDAVVDAATYTGRPELATFRSEGGLPAHAQADGLSPEVVHDTEGAARSFVVRTTNVVDLSEEKAPVPRSMLPQSCENVPLPKAPSPGVASAAPGGSASQAQRSKSGAKKSKASKKTRQSGTKPR